METQRRVLIVTVRGEVGAQIQSWRERYDPTHAARLPPHLTICYRPPVDAPLDAIEAQVRHAFPSPVPVKLGGVFVLEHREAPLVVSVLDTALLDTSRQKLFDGTHAQMGGRQEWPWHITCIRYGYNKDRETLLQAAASELCLDAAWTIDEVSCLELHDKRWRSIADWRLASSPP